MNWSSLQRNFPTLPRSGARNNMRRSAVVKKKSLLCWRHSGASWKPKFRLATEMVNNSSPSVDEDLGSSAELAFSLGYLPGAEHLQSLSVMSSSLMMNASRFGKTWTDAFPFFEQLLI